MPTHVELDVERCAQRVTRALSSLSWPRRALISTLHALFKLLFWRRWRLSVEHIQLTLLPHNPRDAERLADASLKSLAITVTGALKRVFAPPREDVRREPLMSLEERVTRLGVSGVEVEGAAQLIDALSSGRGVVILSAHLGAWEELISLGSWLDRPVWVISKRLKVGVAQRLWDRSRKSGPPRLDRGPRARRIIQALRAQAVVADVLDQHDPRAGALQIEFLGRPAWTSPDLARIALLGDALIVPLFLIRGERDQSNTTLYVGSVIDARQVQERGELSRAERVERVTELCVREIESAILRAPEQWMWLHRRWKVKTRSQV